MNISIQQIKKLIIALLCLIIFKPTQAQERHLTTNCIPYQLELSSNPNQPTVNATNGTVIALFLGNGLFEIRYEANQDFVGSDELEISLWEDATTVVENNIRLNVFDCATIIGRSKECEAYEFEIESANNPPTFTALNGEITQQYIGNTIYRCLYTPNQGFDGIDELEAIHWSNNGELLSTDYRIDVTNCEALTPTHEIADFSGNIYPNPTSSHVLVEQIPEDVQELLLTDMAGRPVMKEKITSNNQVMNLQQMENGMYILIMKGQSSNHKQIIVKL